MNLFSLLQTAEKHKEGNENLDIEKAFTVRYLKGLIIMIKKIQIFKEKLMKEIL